MINPSDTQIFYISIISALVIVTYVLWLFFQSKKVKPVSKQLYTISLPPKTKWEPDRARAFIEHFATRYRSAVLQIVAKQGSLKWQVAIASELDTPDYVTRAIHSIFPEAEITVSEYTQPQVSGDVDRVVVQYGMGSNVFPPLKDVSQLSKLDPLASIVQAMSGLKRGTQIVYTLYVEGPISKRQRKKLNNKITKPVITCSDYLLVGIIFSLWHSRQRVPRYIPEHHKVFNQRINYDTLCNARLAIQYDIDLETIELSPIDVISSFVSNEYSTDFNFLKQLTRFRKRDFVPITDSIKKANTSLFGFLSGHKKSTFRWNLRSPLMLTTQEMAALWHLPHDEFTASEIQWLTHVRPPEALIKNDTGIVIGDCVIEDKECSIHMPENDRETHMTIIGKTGMGKTSFMHNLIHQDIAEGKGVAVLDPHGQLVRDILRFSIPENRKNDVVIIDIANRDFPPPLNPFIIPGEKDSLASGQIVSILESIYSLDGAPRVKDMLAAAFETLGSERSATVRDVVKLFNDVEYRYKLIDKVANPVVQEFWEEFEGFTPSAQRDLVYPVLHRMRQFYGNLTLYPMMCHPDAFDFSKLISDQKIILVSLGIDERVVPAPERRLLGTLLVSQIQLAAMAAGKDDPTSLYFYIDEAQNFVTSPLDVILAQSRKFGIHLTLANQFLGQLKGETLEAVIGNIGAMVTFQVGADDAQVISKYYQPAFRPDSLTNLSAYSAAIKMRYYGQTQPPFSIETLPPPGLGVSGTELTQAKRREKEICDLSIKNYTPKSKDEVFEWLMKRYPGPRFGKTESPVTQMDWIVSEG